MRPERIEKLAGWLGDQASSARATARALEAIGPSADPEKARTTARLLNEVEDLLLLIAEGVYKGTITLPERTDAATD